jgi:hypothetical protein
MVEAMSEAFAVCWSHSLQGGSIGFPLNGFFGDDIVFVAKMYEGEEEMALNDARREFAMLLISHLFLLTNLLSLSVSELFPLGNNKICISITALRLTALFCS